MSDVRLFLGFIRRKGLDNSLKLCCNSEQFSILRDICFLTEMDIA